MTLFAAFVDKSIKLTNDKSALSDRCWTTGVVPYFQNSGRVVTNLKKLKEAVDFHAQEERSWGAVFTPTMQRDVARMFAEAVSAKPLAVNEEVLGIVKAVMERVELHNRYRQQVLGFSATVKSKMTESAIIFKQATRSLEIDNDQLMTLRVTPQQQPTLLTATEPSTAPPNLPLNTVVKRAFVSELYEQSKKIDAGIEARRQQITSAKRMVRELKGKEAAIKWGMVRNEKRETKKAAFAYDKENRAYQESLRRQFLDYLSARHFEDAQMRSILLKEQAIEKRLQKLKAIAEDRLKVVEGFRTSLIDAEWRGHLEAEERERQAVLREEYVERLRDERAFREEVATIERIIEFEERKRKRLEDIDFEQF